jgi:K+-transporting ATPase KdpF subunit
MHDGCGLRDSHRFVLCNCDCLRAGLFTAMTTLELVLSSAMALGLAVYLVYAMLRPERF